MKSIVFKAVLGMILFLTVTGLPLSAQVRTGTITGTSRDASGAIVPGVSVSYKNVETGVTGTAITGDLGTYILPSLPVGTYDMEASLAGFRPEVLRGISVTVGSSVAVNFSLTVGGIAETVEVNAIPPQVNTTDASVGGLVSENTIRELPLNGRDWLQLATLQAGVIGGVAQQSSAVSTNSRAARGNGENLYIS